MGRRKDNPAPEGEIVCTQGGIATVFRARGNRKSLYSICDCCGCNQGNGEKFQAYLAGHVPIGTLDRSNPVMPGNSFQEDNQDPNQATGQEPGQEPHQATGEPDQATGQEPDQEPNQEPGEPDQATEQKPNKAALVVVLGAACAAVFQAIR